MNVPANCRLERLSSANLVLDDPAQDIRGRHVVDKAGQKLGKVDDLFVDQQERKVRFVEVRHGGVLGIAGEHFLIPVDVITRIDAHTVYIDQTSDRIETSPVYDPKVVEDAQYYADLYRYYGALPWWEGAYLYPGIYDPMP